MTIHREGKNWVIGSGLLCLTATMLLLFVDVNISLLLIVVFAITLVFFLLILQFFRYPHRVKTRHENYIIAPADGKVVVIETTKENEYFKDKRIQVSIFMSPINVHANWFPISGLVKYLRYHKGKYLVAWHPKASTENERSTIVIEKDTKRTILIRQIAGALAKRIVYYPHEGDMIRQGAEMGFIKFGSRVDVYLPLDAKINVHLNQKVTGSVTVLAEFVK